MSESNGYATPTDRSVGLVACRLSLVACRLSLESEHRSKLLKFLIDDVTPEKFFGLPSGIYLVEALTQSGHSLVQKVVVE